MKQIISILLALTFIQVAAQDEKTYTEFSMDVEASNRYSIKFVGFARLDQYDDRRTHADIRELYWQTYNNNWEFSFGFKKVFWGKTESVHLVDIINQTDAVESFDGEAKLGEFMAQATYFCITLFQKAGISRKARKITSWRCIGYCHR